MFYNNNISALLGLSRLLFSEISKPAFENGCSICTEQGGRQNIFLIYVCHTKHNTICPLKIPSCKVVSYNYKWFYSLIVKIQLAESLSPVALYPRITLLVIKSGNFRLASRSFTIEILAGNPSNTMDETVTPTHCTFCQDFLRKFCQALTVDMVCKVIFYLGLPLPSTLTK